MFLMDASTTGYDRKMCCAPRPKCRLPMYLRRVVIRQDAQHQAKLEGTNDARTGMPHGIPRGAMCVQRFDDSLNSAIHTTYRISLRSSSMPEPRDPLLKVLIFVCFVRRLQVLQRVYWGPHWQASLPRKRRYSKRQGFYLERAEAPR